MWRHSKKYIEFKFVIKENTKFKMKLVLALTVLIVAIFVQQISGNKIKKVKKKYLKNN